MSEDGDNKQSRDQATETLFNFDERENVTKDKPLDEEIGTVNYDEELSLQNIFIEKSEDEVQGVPRDGSGDSEEGAAAAVRDETVADRESRSSEAARGVESAEFIAAEEPVTTNADSSDAEISGEGQRSHGLNIDSLEGAAGAGAQNVQAGLQGEPEQASDDVAEQSNSDTPQDNQENEALGIKVNLAPTAGEDQAASVAEGAATLTGRMTAEDPDRGDTVTFSMAEGVSAPEGFVLSDDGSYTFDPADAAYDHLNVGDSVVLTVPVVVSDEAGAQDSANLVITVTGTNDAPIAGADILQGVDEGAAAISGQLTSTDVDDNSSVRYVIADGISAPEGFVLHESGAYSFDPGAATYDSLNVGDTRTLSIPVAVVDEHGAMDTSLVQITVTGTNDAPVAGAAVIATVDEGDSTLHGAVTSSDVDEGATATYTVSEGVQVPDGFVLNEDGSFRFDPSDDAYGSLGVGDSVVLTVPVTVTDEHGATDTTQIQITVQGTNDAPVAGALFTNDVFEGGEPIAGQLFVSDGDADSEATYRISGGFEAPAGFVLSDDGSYTFDPADAAYDHLNVGDSTVLTIPVVVSDEHGATDTSQIQITVTGTNDAPIAGAEIHATVDEGAGAIRGQLTSSDLDDGATATFSISEGAGVPAGFELAADGSYSFDPSDDTYDHLNVGDSVVLTVPVTVTDEHGATDTSQIQITVVGTNDAPVAGADVTHKVDEGARAIKGQLTSSDLDEGATAKFSVTEGAEIPAGFELAADGTYSFDPTDEAYDHLNVGDSTVLTVPVTVTDEHGATDTSQIQFTVVGTNDAPVAGADVAYKVEEGARAIKGQLTSTDLDEGATAKFSVSEGADVPAGFELAADGTYSFDPTDEAYDHLNVGDSTVLTVPVTVTDEHGATDASQIQIKVVGTNDAPVAGADVREKVEEGGSTIKGQLTSSDPDDGATARFSVSEGADVPAGFELAADGTYSFDPTDEAYDHLNVGDSTVLTVPVTVTDEHGATDTSQIQIKVVGTNDAPVAGADVAHKVEEGANAIKGQLTSFDLDEGATAKFSVSEGAEIPAGFELAADGTYSFDPSDEAYDHLNVGDSAVLTVPVTVTDEHGATDTAQIQIKVVGTNDAPVAGADIAHKVEEGTSTIRGQLTSSDLDDGASARFSVAEGVDVPAGFELAADGTYSFDPSDEAYDHLNVGDSTVLTVPVAVTDEHGATDTSQIQIKVVGTNDAPVAGADVAHKVEEGAGAIKGQLTSSDLDDGSTAKFSVSEGAELPAGFELAADGSYSFDPSDEAYDHLNVGDSTLLTVPVTVTDEHGATDTSQIQIKVVGTNDAPVAGADVREKVEEGGSVITGQLTASDLDEGATAKFSVTEGAEIPAGFELAADGTYTFDPSDDAYDHLNVGDSTVLTVPVTVTDEHGATDTSQIQIKVVGTNDTPVAGADVTERVEEGGSAIKGQLSSSDLDEGASAKFSVSEGADVPAGFELAADGTYSFDPSDEAYDHLNVGDSTVLTVPVTVTDEHGATDTSQIQIKVVGTNDAPVAGADVARKVEEGASAIKGQLTSSDLDGGATAKFSVTEGAEVPAGFELAADGTYSFDPSDEAYDQLNVGDSTVLTVPVTVTDEHGATDTSQIQIKVVGTNDAPVAGADVKEKVEEGGGVIKGQLSSSDVDDGASAKFSVTEGAELPAGFELAADGTYSFDPSDEAYDHLNVGDSTVLTVPVTVTDEHGATDTSQIQIKVVGTNDAPVAGADVAHKVEEGANAIKGQLTSSDLDEGAAAKFAVSEGAEVPAGFELAADGTYSFDPSDEAYDHLNVGDSTVLTVPVTVTDEHGATGTSQIQIKVVGTNDAPVAGANVREKVEEGGNAIKGQLSASDLDEGATAKFSVTEGAEVPAGFELAADGTYSFDPSDEAYDHLNVGDATVLTVPVTVTDEHGATDTSQIQIKVVGTNDAPVAGAAVKEKVEEGGSAIKGQLTASDLDEGAAAKFTVSEGAEVPAGFELAADGTYSFDPSDAAYDHLNVGDATVLTVPVTVTDEHGATDTSQIQIKVVGTNDAPVAGAAVKEKVEEGGSAIKGQLASTDLDDGATAKFSVAEGVDVPAGFELAADGTYSFDPADEAYDHLNVGDSTVLTVPVTVTDDNGATDTSQIQIKVVGTNDAPVAGADVVQKVEEGGSVVKGQLDAQDVDQDSSLTFSVDEDAELPDGFTLSSDGSYSFDPADDAYDHLGAGDVAELTVPVTVTDEHGATDSAQIQIKVIGTNDAPVAGVDVAHKVDEGGAAIKGKLDAHDTDDGAKVTYSVSEGAEVPAGFELTSDGTYSFDPSDDAYDHLNVGDSTVVTVPVTVTDEHGASDTSHIQIKVEGTNDGPVAGADVKQKVEEGGSAIKGQLTSSDVDEGATVKFSVTEGAAMPAGFELAADGTYSFDPSDEAYDHLNVGDSTVLTVPVTVSDEHGATDTAQIQIKVYGTNDAPIAGADVNERVKEGGSVIKGQLEAKDLDDDATTKFSVSEGVEVPAGFELAADGSYSFDPSDEAYDHLNVGDSTVLTVPVTVTDEHGATDTSQIQIKVYGTNDAPVAGADVVAKVEEGDSVIKGKLDAKDVDEGASVKFSVAEGAEVPDGFVLEADGTYAFDPSDEAYDHLNVGDIAEISVPITVTDEHGATDTSQIQIKVVGTNDAPIAGADVVQKVDEGDSVIKGQLDVKDLDDGASVKFSVAEGADIPDGFTLEGDGTYSFDPSDEAYDHLNVGDSVTLNVPVTVTDENGATDTSQIRITVNGTNDTPVASDQKLATEEGGSVVSGQLPATDVDDGAQLTFKADGPLPEGFTLHEDGSYDFDPADAAYDGLGEGESHIQAVTYEVTDEHGASASGTLYVGVDGTNDNVSMVVDTDPDSNSVAENAVAGSPVGVVAHASDADGDEVKYSIVDEKGEAVTDGAFAIDAKSGVVTVNDPEQLDYETADSHDITVQATSADGSTSQQSFSIAVTDIDENRGPEAGNDIGRIWISESTNEVVENMEVGTFGDDHADVSDWGELVDGKAVFTEGDITVTTSVSEGRLTAYNKAGHVGFGIGNEDRQGLDRTETLTIEIDGGDANRVDFTLGGLGGYFDENSRYATEVKITAYDHDGELIETQGGYRQSGQTEDTYSFETETPVSRFEITSEGSMGTFVVKNMTLSATDTINIPGHWENVTEDGSITIDVLSNDTDPDGDVLSIIGVENPVMLDGVEVGSAEIVEVDGKQHIQFTPGEGLSHLSEGESQKLSFEYKISDGEGGVDSAKVSVTVEGVNDAPEVSATDTDVTSGSTHVIGNVQDVDGTIESSSLSAEYGKVELDDDGNINYTVKEGFEGEDVVSVSVTDDSGATTTESIALNVDPANEKPVTTKGDDYVRGTEGDDKIYAQEGDDKIRAGDGDDTVFGEEGNDKMAGDAGDDLLSGGAGRDMAYGGEGNDTYIMNAGDGSDHFSGGLGGGWTDTIELTANPEDGDSPWSIIVDGEQVEYDLAAGALELEPDTSGVIKLADGSELTFEGVESINW